MQLKGGRRAETQVLAAKRDLMLHLHGEENNVAERILNSLRSWTWSEFKHGPGLFTQSWSV